MLVSVLLALAVQPELLQGSRLGLELVWEMAFAALVRAEAWVKACSKGLCPTQNRRLEGYKSFPDHLMGKATAPILMPGTRVLSHPGQKRIADPRHAWSVHQYDALRPAFHEGMHQPCSRPP